MSISELVINLCLLGSKMLKPEDEKLAIRIGEGLLRGGFRVATVETTAGGLISARLLSIPGASRWFERGIVAYSEKSKIDALGGVGINPKVLKKHGSVSPAVVEMLVENFCKIVGADFGVAESGLAGPKTSQRSKKSVGNVFIAIKTPNGVISEDAYFDGTRLEIMQKITRCALEMLSEAITRFEDNDS
jgi:PncC family amidohydrolase